MRIDFITSSLKGGGAERVLVLMANSLAKNKKNEMSVITLYKGKEAYDLDPSVKRVQLKLNKLIPNHTLSSIVNLVKHYKNKSDRPDVIVSFSTTTNFVTIIVAKLFSIKIIGQEHISHMGSGENKRLIIDITRRHLYRKADLITVLTSFDEPYYKKHGAEVYVMPNPCSFKPITENSHKREKTILAVGSLNRYHHKGFDTLINLIVPIFKAHPDWKIKIAGSGDDGLKYLTELAEKNNILDKIIFTGFITNISELMYESSIFILSSRYEGLPMVLLEALSQGMACISFDCLTGPSDIINNNENGLLIEDQNIEKMQQGLSNLIDNEEFRENLANNGIKSLDKFNISTITKQYEVLFNKLVSKT